MPTYIHTYIHTYMHAGARALTHMYKWKSTWIPVSGYRLADPPPFQCSADRAGIPYIHMYVYIHNTYLHNVQIPSTHICIPI